VANVHWSKLLISLRAGLGTFVALWETNKITQGGEPNTSVIRYSTIFGWLWREERMKQIILAATTFTLLLVGCAPLVEQRQQDVFEQAKAISAECHEKRLSGQLKGFADAARCSNTRMRQIWADAGFPYMDLVELMAADRLAIAERMDKGELYVAEANVKMAKLGVRVISEAQRRDAEARQTAIQAQQVQQAAFGRTH
jgi:hypothetical protein